MSTQLTIVELRWLQKLTALSGVCVFFAGAVSFSGWVFDIPRLTDWLDDGISIQPNTAVLVALSGIAVTLLQYGQGRLPMIIGGFVIAIGGLNLLQYITGADYGFNHQLLFGRQWGFGATMAPGRIGPPASLSFVVIGISFVLLSAHEASSRRFVPGLALFVVLLMLFSLLGYLFGARDFYAIPWLSAISLPSATMLMMLAICLIMSAPQHHPMLFLCERSGAGTMARTVLPILIIMIPLLIWLRVKGYELGLFDLGTSRALGAAVLMIGVLALMWIALLALRRREQRERDTDRRKDEFLATLAHELRNPLAPIRNATSILKLAPGDTEVSLRAIETIDRQLTHLVRLVDDLLDTSRISLGKLDLRREKIELASVVYQAVETCRPLAESAAQEIVVTLPPQPIYLDADPVRLVQVVSNLLNNASKFTGKHGRIGLVINQHNDDVVISVKDDGIGIPPHMLDAVFDLFLQVGTSPERLQSGLGIGLTLAKRLVELHGGSIKAVSEGLGKGSEFIICLPVAAHQSSMQEERKGLDKPGARCRILIVDDNLDSANTLAELLKLGGNETFIAHDGEEAVSAAETYRPAVIVLDIGLPKLNGYEVCRHIRKNAWAKNVLMIALTGWGQEDDRRKSAEAGFDNHLVKPVDFTELLKLLASRPLQDNKS